MTFFKTAATALVLSLATLTVADAATSRPAAIHGVASTSTSKVSLVKRQHVAHRVAKNGRVAHRALGTRIVRTHGLRHVAENHRVGAKTSVVR